jgi:myo-inositol-1(or 4)-monophosphatase
MAAGSLMVREAGGAVSDMRGGAHSVASSPDLLADNHTIHEQILTLFAEVFEGQFRVPMPPIG